jgi:hypothetical protein
MHSALIKAQPNCALCIINFALTRRSPLCIVHYELCITQSAAHCALCIMNHALIKMAFQP